MTEASLDALFRLVGLNVLTAAIDGVTAAAPGLPEEDVTRIAMGIVVTTAVAMGASIGMGRDELSERISAAVASAAGDVFGDAP